MNVKTILADFIVDMNAIEKMAGEYLNNTKKSLEKKEAIFAIEKDLQNAISRVNASANSLAHNTALLSSKDGEILAEHVYFFTERIIMLSQSVDQINKLMTHLDAFNDMNKKRVDSISDSLSTFMEWVPKVKESYNNQLSSSQTTSLDTASKLKAMILKNRIIEFNNQVNPEIKNINNDESLHFSKEVYDKAVEVQEAFDKLVKGNDNLHQLLQPLKKTIMSMKEAIERSHLAPHEISLLTKNLDYDYDPDFADDLSEKFGETIDIIKLNCKEIHETMEDRMTHFNKFVEHSFATIKNLEKEEEKEISSSMSL